MDLVLRNARIYRREGLWNIGIDGDRIAEISKSVSSSGSETVDVAGRLVTPSFVDMHFHLDATLTAPYFDIKSKDSLLEGISLWGDIRRQLSSDLLVSKARKAIMWMISNGTTRLRTHVDTSESDFGTVRTILETRDIFADLMDIEVTAFPQDGILTDEEYLPRLRKAIELGADNVGLIPHNEYTREDGVESVGLAFDIAEEYNRRIDGHVDETDDPQSRFLEAVAAETIRRSYEGLVTAGHTTAMHSYSNAYVFKLIRILKRAEVTIVPNPLTNVHLQGRFDAYPKRRGLTRVKQLTESNVNVALGHDCVMDPWYPLGMGDMIQPLWLTLHIEQMMSHEDLTNAFDFITYNAAEALGVSEDYGVEKGKLADLVVLDARDEIEALATLAPRRYVFKGGEMIARSSHGVREVKVNGRFEELESLTER